MDPGEFTDTVLQPLEARVPGIDPTRIWVAYQDAMNVADIIDRFEREIGGRDVSDLNTQGKHAEGAEVYCLEISISTLHKALIEFATIFMVVLLHELDQRPGRGSTVLTLCESPTALALDQAALQAAYCLYIYRNKIVVHHDVPRTFMTKRNRVDGRRWLKPFVHVPDVGAAGAGITAKDFATVVVLQRRYSRLSQDPNFACETNPYETVDGLFYIVPGPYGGQASADRAAINKIAERVGCQSMTVPEIIRTIDAFAHAVVWTAPTWVRLSR